jgi:hypothetical protein
MIECSIEWLNLIEQQTKKHTYITQNRLIIQTTLKSINAKKYKQKKFYKQMNNNYNVKHIHTTVDDALFQTTKQPLLYSKPMPFILPSLVVLIHCSICIQCNNHFIILSKIFFYNALHLCLQNYKIKIIPLKN